LPNRAGYHKWLLAAMLIALCVTIGYLFLFIPNLELFTAAVVASGFLTGPGLGLLIGAAAALLFSLFNPYGAPTPPLLLAQIAGMALVGWSGGWLRRPVWQDRSLAAKAFFLGAIGFILTLIYDVLTTLSFALVMAGGDARKIWASFIYGMGFYGLHLLSNTLIFALLLPPLLQRLRHITTR
jgi:hypothetical protein